MASKKQSSDTIIKRVRNIRANNNDLWMDILRLAYKLDPDEVRSLLYGIDSNDKEISHWLGKL